MSIKVYPYKQGSKSASVLAKHLQGKVLKVEGSKFKPKNTDIVVNWGASSLPSFSPARVLNSDLSKNKDKLVAFKYMKEGGVSIPPFYTDKEEIPEDGYPVMCRTILNGHSASGLVVANSPEECVQAQLYTKYIKKKDEYRVHVFQGEVFFVQRKAKKQGVTEVNWKVRNLANGFVFVEADLEAVPECVKEQAVKACEALGLDFGGVDVIYNEQSSTAYVLEVNCACGLEERTAEKYALAII